MASVKVPLLQYFFPGQQVIERHVSMLASKEMLAQRQSNCLEQPGLDHNSGLLLRGLARYSLTGLLLSAKNLFYPQLAVWWAYIARWKVSQV